MNYCNFGKVFIFFVKSWLKIIFRASRMFFMLRMKGTIFVTHLKSCDQHSIRVPKVCVVMEVTYGSPLPDRPADRCERVFIRLRIPQILSLYWRRFWRQRSLFSALQRFHYKKSKVGRIIGNKTAYDSL